MTDRWHSGPGGFLLDRNGDGFIDDLALRIVLPPESDRIPAGIWRALIDLGARAGLETAGLPERILLDAAAPVPRECVQVLVLPADPAAESSARSLVVRSPRDIERLLYRRATGESAGARLDQAAWSGNLAALFEPGGLLIDRDGDLIADGTRCCLRLPDPCPAAIGRAAVELAPRIGMESGGIDLPIGLTAADEIPSDVLALDLSPKPVGDLPTGQGRLRLDGRALRVEGDGEGIAGLVTFLATTWPRVRAGAGPEGEIGRLLDELRDLTTAATPEGRVAALIAEAETLPADSELRLLSDDPDELVIASRAFAGRDLAVVPAVDCGEAFALDWEGTWELDDIRELVTRQLAPLARELDRERLDLLVAVSEPREIRVELECELLAALGSNVNLRVLSAYKLGLSWLRETVAPALVDLGGIDRVEIRYAPFEAGAAAGQPHLDMRIRWLQELYPGDELLATALGVPLSAIELIEGTDGETYEAIAYRGGEAVWHDAVSPFARLLPYIPLDPAKGLVTASTGGVRLRAGDRVLFDRTVATDCDRFWDWFQADVLPAVGGHIEQVAAGDLQPSRQPFFDALEVDVWLSEPNGALGVREELDSAAEALHEDIYFGALDWFAAYGEQRCGAPFDGPGAIVPLIHVRRGAPAARVALKPKRRFTAELRLENGERRGIGTIDTLPTPKFTVTGIVVGSGELRAIEVRVEGRQGESFEGTRRLLNAAAGIASAGRDGPTITLLVATGDEAAVMLERPVPVGGLAGVPPALTPPGEDEILFGSDLPARLARVASRPGGSVYSTGRSFRGRPLWAMELTAPMPTERWSPAKLSMQKPTLLIAARHHANEVASTTAALLLAERLTGDGEWRALLDRLNVIVIPFENPDGAALHERLAGEHPTWKHHAARYNAVGFEFYHHLVDESTPYGEARIRPLLNQRWRPDVIVDNHGVPSHEWSQHFAGFGSPPRFPVSYWMVQALLYGIMHHVDDAEHAAFATRLRARIARELALHPELRELNEIYHDRYARWGTSRVPERFPVDLQDGFLCYMSAFPADPESRNLAARTPRTVTLDWVTEVPDETVHGPQLSAPARAHLIANRATMDAMLECRSALERRVVVRDDIRASITIRRRRPLVTDG